MREILGYAPIQPDGSVQIQVPANVPFTIEVVDVNTKRVTAQHTSWLQLKPGETKSCNGCHDPGNLIKPSHGRSGLTLPVNPGAPTTGEPFPDTNAALFANAGETMAQTLARITCETGSTTPCSQILSSDVIYANTWTTGITPPGGDRSTPLSPICIPICRRLRPSTRVAFRGPRNAAAPLSTSRTSRRSTWVSCSPCGI